MGLRGDGVTIGRWAAPFKTKGLLEHRNLTTSHFFMSLIIRHPSPANAVSAELGSSANAKTRSVLFFVF